MSSYHVKSGEMEREIAPCTKKFLASNRKLRPVTARGALGKKYLLLLLGRSRKVSFSAKR